MFQKFIDDFKESTGSALRLTSLAATVAICLFITTCFLCGAAFVFVLQQYGPIYACLAGAGVFFVATLLAAICYAVRKQQVRKKPVEAAKSTMQSALADPMVLAAGLQLVRTIGLKRLIPLAAIGGIALGIMAARRTSENDSPGEGE